VHFVLGRQGGGRGLAMGHYRRGSRELIEVAECPVHSEAGNRIAFSLRDALRGLGMSGFEEHEAEPRGLARHLVVRVAEAGGETQATLVVAESDAGARKALAEALAVSDPAPTSLHLNIHPDSGPFIFGRRTERLYGPERLRERIAGAEFRISPRSFFQTCARPAELLVETVLSWIPGRESRPILDLYAGAGLFALPLARRGQRVIAVEENPESVGDGIASRRAGRIPDARCRFVRGRVEEALEEIATLEGRGVAPRFGAVILDPPREGCPPEVWRRVTRDLRPPRVIYVSCNPRALANDLSLARRGGWRIARVQPVDMFPHTAHIECVALLERAAGRKRNARTTE
jgi:23S rRNA (uracil1939-C5)-methyltransferase